MRKTSKKLEIDLPEEPPSGGYACCPSGDTEYDEAIAVWHKQVNKVILDAIPRGFRLKSSEIKKITVVRHFAEITVEEV